MRYEEIILISQDSERMLNEPEFATIKAIFANYPGMTEAGTIIRTALQENRDAYAIISGEKQEATGAKELLLKQLGRQFQTLTRIVERYFKDKLKVKLGLGPLPSNQEKQRGAYKKLAKNLETLTEEQQATLLSKGWSAADQTRFLENQIAMEAACNRQKTLAAAMIAMTAEAERLKGELVGHFRNMRTKAKELKELMPEQEQLLMRLFPPLDGVSVSPDPGDTQTNQPDPDETPDGQEPQDDPGDQPFLGEPPTETPGPASQSDQNSEPPIPEDEPEAMEPMAA